MSTSSKRQRILELFRTRLRTIQSQSGFQTNLGDTVFLAELPRLGPDDSAAAIAIGIGEDQVSVKQLEKLVVTLPVDVHIVTTVDGADPWALVEAGIADVKKAVEGEDRFLGGLAIDRIIRGSTRTRERESGSQVIGAIVTYFVPFTEVWGHPDQ